MVSLGSLVLRELLWEEAAPLLDTAELDLAMLSCTLLDSSTPFPFLLLFIRYCMCFMLRCIDLPSTWLFTTVISKEKVQGLVSGKSKPKCEIMKITLLVLIAKKFIYSFMYPPIWSSLLSFGMLHEYEWQLPSLMKFSTEWQLGRSRRRKQTTDKWYIKYENMRRWWWGRSILSRVSKGHCLD